MASNVGVNVTINSDFRACCPRVLRIFGCCVGKPVDKKVRSVAEKSFSDSSNLECSCEGTPEEEKKDSSTEQT